MALLRQVVFSTSNTNTNLRVIGATLSYGSNSVSASRVLVLNRRPVAVDDVIYGVANEVLTIPYTAVLANDYDVDNDPITVTANSLVSSYGGWITGTNNTFIYEPPVDSLTEDHFAYIVDDGRGGESAGVVTIRFVQENVMNIDTSALNSNGASLSLGGVPGETYIIQASTNLVNWTAISTNTASSTGLIQIMDTDAKTLPTRFYRAVAQ
jgi:hypothetical protein